MRRLGIRIVLAVLANAIALLLAAALLDGVKVDASGFGFAVAVFTIASVLITPIATWIVIRRARALIGVIALVNTFVVLVITDLLSDGFSIEGALDWIRAVVIVWIVNVAYALASGPITRRALGRPAA